MLSIAVALLGAWILNWFGFANLVNTAMIELFNISISIHSYYFISACIGAIKTILRTLKPEVVKINNKD